MEESRLGRLSYKALLLGIKLIPVSTILVYLYNLNCDLFSTSNAIMGFMCRMSLITWAILHVSEIVFKFCIHHKLLLYYILLVDILNFLDFYFPVFDDYRSELLVALSVLGVMLLTMMIGHVKDSKKSLIAGYRKYRRWQLELNRRRIDEGY